MPLEHSTRSLALADGTRDAVGNGVTVGVILTTEVPALDGAREALTLGLAGNVYHLACLEQIDSDLVTSGILLFAQTEFPTPRPAATFALAK